MRERGREPRQPKVAERCDVCREKRLSVREGEKYICEVCLDGPPRVSDNPVVKV